MMRRSRWILPWCRFRWLAAGKLRFLWICLVASAAVGCLSETVEADETFREETEALWCTVDTREEHEQLEEPWPLGLDGCCPVQLWDDMIAGRNRWVLGSRQWQAVHDGRLYLFAGAAQQQRFFKEPDVFAPVLAGNDVVMHVDRQRMVPGQRQHGVFFMRRTYLFANEANLATFSRDPQRYVNGVLPTRRHADAPEDPAGRDPRP